MRYLRVACERPLNIKGRLLGGPKPLICVPLVAQSKEGVFSIAESIAAFNPDFVELRIDYWDFLEVVHEVIKTISDLRERLPHVPFILTCRDYKEGGFKEVNRELKREIYEIAIEREVVDLIDVELAMGYEFIGSLKRKIGRKSVFLIVSHHDFSKGLSEDEIFAKIFHEIVCGADVAKVGVMPRSYEDVLNLLNATLRARRIFPDVPLITVAMGNLGILTRIIGFAWGSDLSFAMLSEASAPGQVSLPILSEIFKAFESLNLWEGGERSYFSSVDMAA